MCEPSAMPMLKNVVNATIALFMYCMPRLAWG